MIRVADNWKYITTLVHVRCLKNKQIVKILDLGVRAFLNRKPRSSLVFSLAFTK